MTIDYKNILQQVMEEHTDLSYEGWRTRKGRWDKLQERFEGSRTTLLNNVAEFQTAYDWCAQLEHRQSAPPVGGYSYTLKHVCEQAVGRYISNGTLIAAMLAHGFKFLMISNSNPNCVFFVTIRSVKQAQK